MNFSKSYALVLPVILLTLSVGAQTIPALSVEKPVAGESQAQQAVFDSSTPLASRVTLPPDAVIRQFHIGPTSSLTVHEPNNAERQLVVKVIEQLPSFARQAFREHVRTISFLDGIAGNGTTMLETDSKESIFNVVIRASILHENISDFLTRKERACYVSGNSAETMSVEAGSLSALLYVLLHEIVHVVDISNRHGQDGSPHLLAGADPSQLIQGIWIDATTTVAAYRSPSLEGSWFRTRKPVSIVNAEATYQMLARTPFVSLYGSSNWYDDIAELVACYYLTQVLHQPYQIILRNGTEILYALKPMDSALVQTRFRWIMPLFG